MPSNSFSLSPRLRLDGLAQRLSKPRPLWGILLGAAAAAAAVGASHLLSPSLGSWSLWLSARVTATGTGTGVVSPSPSRGLAVWAVVAGSLAAAALMPPRRRLLIGLAAGGGAAIISIALASRMLAHASLDPLPPLAVLLGGVAGRLAFGRWEKLAGLRLAESQRQILEAVSRAKSELLNLLTREMRTPVNGVIGIADLLGETGLDGEQRRHLKVFRRSAEALTLLVEDLADLARIESGHLELRVGDINLVALLHEQVAQVRREAEAKGLQVQLTLAADVPRRVRGDAERLGQALGHVLAHSVKATRQGRIAIEVRHHARNPDLLRFLVTDTSLSPVTGTLAGMLEPFSNAAADRARPHSGIGLALARGLATLLGGKLSVRHSPGHGTTAVLTACLPAATEPEVSPAARAAATAAPGATSIPRTLTSVLLVDDNVSTRELLASMLDEGRFAIVPCGTGREALQALEVAPYDVVLMDLAMPELDGWSALRVLRRQERERGLRRTPVIALGTAPLDVERQRCLDAGFDDHLVKPVQKSRLLDAVQRVTRHSVGDAQADALNAPALRPEQRDALALLSAERIVDVRAALQSLGGDASLYLDAIEHLVPALVNWPARFRDALNRRDFDRGRQMALDMQSILDVVAAGPCAAALGHMADALGEPAAATRHNEALAQLDRQLTPLMRTLQLAVERLRAARQEQARGKQGQNSAF